MNRHLLACAAVAALAACRPAGPTAAPSSAPAPATTTATVTPTATATTPPVTLAPASPPPPRADTPIGFGRTVTGDVDGDGRADSVRLVHNQYPQADRRWRWGVVAVLARGGPRYLWRQPGADSNEAQWLTGVTDMNGDGRAEIVASPGGWAQGSFHDVVVLTGGRLVRATASGRLVVFETNKPDAAPVGFGCAESVASSPGREVYRVQAVSEDGGRTYRLTREDYRLTGATLALVRTRTARWTAGTAKPAGFPAGLHCGSLRVSVMG
ncbi:MAG TPA: hypothetical protein VFQ85_05855 [Mycobacteriales bacterium]|jgi:hypothetical protein|nr:hypothetical protein [Mycobacteriales bacterium]